MNTSGKTAQTSLGLHDSLYGGSRLFSINPLILGRCLRGEKRFLLHLLIPTEKQTKQNQKEKKSKKKKACSCPVRLLKINLYLLFMQSFLAGICKKKTTEEKRHPFDNWKESNRGDRNEKFNMS